MVAQERVTRLLQPWLGAAFLQRCDLAQQAADTLNGCDIAQTPIALLAKDLDEMCSWMTAAPCACAWMMWMRWRTRCYT